MLVIAGDYQIMHKARDQRDADRQRALVAALGELALMIVVAAIAAYPSLLIAPNHWDSCLFAWQGRRMLAGDLPYLAVWDQKLPVLLWINAVAAATGHLYGTLYAFQAVAIGVSGFLISAMARRVVGRAAALVAGLAYATLASTLSLLDTGNMTEVYAAPAVVLCLYALLREAEGEARRWLWPVVSGLALGLAAMLRPPAVLIAIALLPLVLAARKAGRMRWQTGVAWSGGFLVVPLMTLAWAARKGILRLMIRDCVLDNLAYATETGAGSRWTWGHVGRSLQGMIGDTWVWHLAAIIGLLIVVLGDDEPRQAVPRSSLNLREMAFVWLAAAFASALPSLRFYGHYYYLTLAPLALLSGWAWQEVVLRFAAKSWRQIVGAWAIATVAGVLIAVGVQSDYAKAFERQREAQPVGEMEQFLASRYRPGDTLAVFGWGVETDLFARLGWPSPTRHPHAIIYPELPGGLQRLREWTDEMVRRPPVWLVCNEREDLVQGRMIPVHGWDGRAGDISRPVVDTFKSRYVEAARFPVRQGHGRAEPAYYVVYRDREATP